MDEKQETVADICAWARGLVKPGETLNNTYELLNGLAVCIEDAHKREVENYQKYLIKALDALQNIYDYECADYRVSDIYDECKRFLDGLDKGGVK